MGTSELHIQTDNGQVGMPSNVCCVVVEYCPGGALKSYLIKNRRKKLAFKVVVQLALDLARGLYSHTPSVFYIFLWTFGLFRIFSFLPLYINYCYIVNSFGHSFHFCSLCYLHSQKIVHRDVKTENMLLDKTRTVKIADFGVARVEASNPNDMTGETGTLGYMAPEVYTLINFNLKSAMNLISLSCISCAYMQHCVGLYGLCST